MKVMLTVVYMKVVTKNTNKSCSVGKVKGMTGPLRTSQTETGSIIDKNLVNVSLQSISWIITTYYFY